MVRRYDLGKHAGERGTFSGNTIKTESVIATGFVANKMATGEASRAEPD
jgi:hypothetical protein